MSKTIYKSKAIQAVIILTAAVLLLSLWPLRLWQETIVGSAEPAAGSVTGPVDESRMITQSFMARYDHLDRIRLWLSDETEGEAFWARIYNDEQKMLVQEEIAIDPAALPGYVSVTVDVDMEPGSMYHLILQGKDSRVFFGCGKFDRETSGYLVPVFYDTDTIDDMTLAADYHWVIPFNKKKTILSGGMVLLLAMGFLLGVRLYYKKKPEADKLITVERAFKFVANPLAAVCVLACLGTIAMGTFGNWALDNTFYVISVLLFGGILFYGINHKREEKAWVRDAAKWKAFLPNLFQTLFLMGAISACCEYWAGLYNIQLAIAERKEMFWLALVIISMFRYKEIFNPYNLIYGIGAGILGLYYYRTHVEGLEELPVIVLRYTILVAILLGLILLRTVIALCQRKLAGPDFLCVGVVAVFFAGIVIFRNGRWWTVVLAAAFTLLYVTYGMWEQRKAFLLNLCRAIVFQFLLATGYSLLFRPYAYWFARFTYVFPSATSAGIYLDMVECAAAVILTAKLSKSTKLRAVWKELVLFGVVSAYIILSLSRTGYAAAAAIVLFIVFLTAAGTMKKKLLYYGRTIGFMVLAVLVCFPVIFTAQRNIPALVSKPYLFDTDLHIDDVMRGRKADSKEFMRIGNFTEEFLWRIFAIPRNTVDIYGEKEALPEKPVISQPENGEETNYAGIDLREDYSNGRTEIWKIYIEQLNLTGHYGIRAEGSPGSHAHNIYLQIAYDHGILVGIWFVVFAVIILVKSCRYYRRNQGRIIYSALPAVATIMVAVAGIGERLYHVSNPCWLVMMLAIAPLLFREKAAETLKKESGVI